MHVDLNLRLFNLVYLKCVKIISFIKIRLAVLQLLIACKGKEGQSWRN
jgi:hypothetical protein